MNNPENNNINKKNNNATHIVRIYILIFNYVLQDISEKDL